MSHFDESDLDDPPGLDQNGINSQNTEPTQVMDIRILSI